MNGEIRETHNHINYYEINFEKFYVLILRGKIKTTYYLQSPSGSGNKKIKIKIRIITTKAE